MSLIHPKLHLDSLAYIMIILIKIRLHFRTTNCIPVNSRYYFIGKEYFLLANSHYIGMIMIMPNEELFTVQTSDLFWIKSKYLVSYIIWDLRVPMWACSILFINIRTSTYEELVIAIFIIINIMLFFFWWTHGQALLSFIIANIIYNEFIPISVILLLVNERKEAYFGLVTLVEFADSYT